MKIEESTAEIKRIKAELFLAENKHAKLMLERDEVIKIEVAERVEIEDFQR